MFAALVGEPITIVALFIPIIAIVMGIGCGIIALVLDYLKRRRLMELFHQQRMAAIDKGVELPPMPLDLLTADIRRKRSNPLLKGLLLVFIGITVAAALYANEGWEPACYGLITAGIGLAYLIYYAVEGKKLAAEEREEKLAETKAAAKV